MDAGSDATHVCAGVGTEQITANTLASGSTYAITYSETDVATNESGQSPSLNVTIDTGAPSSTITTSVNPIYE